MASPLIKHWVLDPAVRHLNHGSFGACPRAVLEFQDALRLEMENNPVDFLATFLPEKLDSARAELARFIQADPSEIGFVSNATAGVNAVLRSLKFKPGDQILATNHTYEACRKALAYMADTTGVEIVTVSLPFPVQHEDEITETILSGVTGHTRLALIDHVTSPTALILPITKIIKALAQRGVEVLIDGAHAPGMLPLSLSTLGAAFYTGNAHKWLCAPKGAAFLYVRADRAQDLHPAVISRGYGRGLHEEFDWVGTDDPTAWLAIPAAIHKLPEIAGTDWPGIMRRNHDLAVEGRKILLESLDLQAPCPDAMIGSMSAIPLPALAAGSPASRLDGPGLFRWLREAGFVTAVIEDPLLVLRTSAYLYNSIDDFQGLAERMKGFPGSA